MQENMKGIKNKPAFIDVYTRVSDVVETLGLQRKIEVFS